MVDTSLHVLDKNGNPSSNPYAADEVANAVHGDGSARAPMSVGITSGKVVADVLVNESMK